MARICREDVRYGSGPLPMPKETAPSHWRPVAAPLVVLAVAMLVGGAAHAQGFQVSPIQVQFAPGQLGTTLAVTNNTNEASVIQARPFQWSQSGDTDILKETTDLAVSPPITKIDAGQTQTFRIVLRHAPTGAESSFRLLLDQLPPPATPGTVKVALRFSIPVFSRPGTRIATDIAWRVVVDQAGAVLVATNRGGEHLHILNTTLTPPRRRAADGVIAALALHPGRDRAPMADPGRGTPPSGRNAAFGGPLGQRPRGRYCPCHGSLRRPGSFSRC